MPASRDGFLNKKQELFCRFLARGSLQTEAYELAGYAPSSSNACTLAQKPEIKARVAELREEFQKEQESHEIALANARRLTAETGDPSHVTKQVEWTFNRVMDMIAENVKLAQVANQFGAANDALKMLGDAMSLFDKARAASTPPANPVAFIGKVVAGLEEAAEAPMKPANPLAPAAE